MTNRQRIAHDEPDEIQPPIFTPLHLEYLRGRFGNFKQHQSPRSVDDMVTVSHLASEQIGANQVLDHISALIGDHREKVTATMADQAAAFAGNKE